MNNTTMFYVGIDVSKDKSDICIKDEKGNDLIQRFEITNKRADLEMLYETIESIKRNIPGNSDVIFGMGPTILGEIGCVERFSNVKKLGVSTVTVNELVKKFEKIGILKEITGKQRYKKYIFTDYVEIMESNIQDNCLHDLFSIDK